MNIKVLSAIAVVAILFFWGISTHNKLVSLEEDVQQSWAQVENQYQRRADLIPNLVNIVQGAADFEQETLTEVIEARSRATSININPGDLSDPALFNQFQQAQEQLGGALSRLLVSVERYPQLTATENFRDLQVQLEGTENRIATERMRFNQSSQQFNTTVRRFPANMIAGVIGFEPKHYFEAREGSDTAPEVNFN
ncbi:MAG: LemA family protein [Balneolaceae bacterium]